MLLASCAGNERAGQSKHQQAAVYLQMGSRYLQLGKTATAKKKLNKALALDADNGAIHATLGILYEGLQQNKIAAKHYKQALEIDADDANTHNNYARLLCATGDHKAAIALASRALAIPNPSKWLSYTGLGDCYLQNANSKLAQKNYKLALQHQSNYAPALLAMQKISYQQGDFLLARVFLHRYLASNQHTAATLDLAIKTEQMLGKKNLVQKYRKLRDKFPKSDGK